MSINRMYYGTQKVYSFLENGNNGGNVGGDCNCDQEYQNGYDKGYEDGVNSVECNCDEAYNNGYQAGVDSVECDCTESDSYRLGYQRGYEAGQADCEGAQTPLAQIGYEDVVANNMLQKMVDICNTYDTYVNFDGSNADGMFNKEGNKALNFVPVVNLENVTSLYAFLNGQNTITLVPKMNTSNVTHFNNCFEGCSNLQEVPDWDFTSANDMTSCFRDCSSLKRIVLNTPNCTNLREVCLFNSGVEHIELDGTSAESLGEFFGWYGDPVANVKYFVVKNLKCDWNDDNGLCVCENITYESIKDQIMWLADMNEQETKTLKIHPNTMALLSEDDVEQASAKNWIITA